MSETTPLIKAALNLRVGVGFDVYGQKSGNFDSNIASKGGKSHTDFCQKDGIGFF